MGFKGYITTSIGLLTKLTSILKNNLGGIAGMGVRVLGGGGESGRDSCAPRTFAIIPDGIIDFMV